MKTNQSASASIGVAAAACADGETAAYRRSSVIGGKPGESVWLAVSATSYVKAEA